MRKQKKGDVFYDACGEGLYRYTVRKVSSNKDGIECDREPVRPDGSDDTGSASRFATRVGMGNPPGISTARETIVEAIAELERALKLEVSMCRRTLDDAEQGLRQAQRDMEIARGNCEKTGLFASGGAA